MRIRKPLELSKSKARSAVTNGKSLLADVDGRSLIARRYRDVMCSIAADQGGAETLSETRLQLIRRFAAASVLAESLESKIANGESVDIQQHALLSSTLCRLASRIGIDRKMRTVVPSLREYIDGKYSEAAE